MIFGTWKCLIEKKRKERKMRGSDFLKIKTIQQTWESFYNFYFMW